MGPLVESSVSAGSTAGLSALVVLIAAVVNVYGNLLTESKKLKSMIEIERERGRLLDTLEERRAAEELRGSYNRLRGPFLQVMRPSPPIPPGPGHRTAGGDKRRSPRCLTTKSHWWRTTVRVMARGHVRRGASAEWPSDLRKFQRV